MPFQTIPQCKFNYPLDVYQTQDKTVIQIAAVGLDKEDINIQRKGRQIFVRYDKCEHQQDDKQQSYIKRGISRKSFNFAWKVSQKYDIDNIQVTLDKGLLSINIPKLVIIDNEEINKIEIK